MKLIIHSLIIYFQWVKNKQEYVQRGSYNKILWSESWEQKRMFWKFENFTKKFK